MDNVAAQHVGQIFTLIQKDPIVRITASPGSGISSHLSSGLALNNISSVVVTPSDFESKLASIELTRKYPSIRNDHGINSLAKRDTSKASITFLSRREVINKFLDNGISNCSWDGQIYILDNLEKDNINIDLILGFWKYCVLSGKSAPSIVLIGNNESSLDYNILKGVSDNTKPYNIQIQHSNMVINYHDRYFRLADDKIYPDMVSVASRYHNDHNMVGDFILFVPSTSETNILRQLFNKSKNMQNSLIVAIDDKSDPAEIDRLLKISDRRKIIIIPSEFESGIQIPYIGLVIDSLRELTRVETSVHNISTNIDNITSQLSQARSSRTSRTFEGIYYPMTTQSKFKDLPSSRDREINRLPLDRYYLNLINSGYDAEILLPSSVNSYSMFTIRAKNLGILDFNNNLTTIGEKIIDLPLTIENSTTLVKWSSNNLPLFPAILAIAVIEKFNDGYLRIPYKNKTQSTSEYNSTLSEFKRENYSKFKGDNDLETAMNVIMKLFEDTKCLTGGPSQISKWAMTNKIQHSLVRDTIELIDVLISMSSSWGADVQVSNFDVKSAINHLRSIITDTYKNRIMILDGRLYKELYSGKLYSLNLRGTYSSLITNRPRNIIGLVTNTYEVNHKINQSILMGIDINPNPISLPMSPPSIITPSIMPPSIMPPSIMPPSIMPPPVIAPSNGTPSVVDDSSESSSLEIQMPTSFGKKRKGAKTTKKSKYTKGKNTKLTMGNAITMELSSWRKEFDVSVLNLDDEDLEVWNNNFHIRQVLYNNHYYPNGDWPLVVAGRPIDEIDRSIRMPDDEQPSFTKDYKKRQPGEIRTTEYWGQRKLFMVSLEFLVYYGHLSDTVVYAGAAPGKYFKYLSSLFPNHTFHLYDPRTMSVSPSKSLIIYKQLFTDETAREWADKDFIFLSDIRRQVNVDGIIERDAGAVHRVANDDNPNVETEQTVKEDMEMQKGWITIMKPLASSLKFRLPYSKGITSYFPGDIRIQPWAPQASTETRLIVTDPSGDNMIDYDNLWYSDAMYFHNTTQRTIYYDHASDDVEGIDHCYDCSTEVRIITGYLYNQKGISDDDELLAGIKEMSEHISTTIDPIRKLGYN